MFDRETGVQAVLLTLGTTNCSIVKPGGTTTSTVTVIMADPSKPPESVTDAVTVWVPTLSVVEKLPPLPIAPSRFETQDRPAVRSPFSASSAVPEKAMLVPSGNEDPSTGLVIVTAGGVFANTVTVMMSEPGSPPESVTDAVIV